MACMACVRVQESGRAGRDGLPSVSVVYFSQDDQRVMEFLINKQRQAPGGGGGGQDKKAERETANLHAIATVLESQVKPPFCPNTRGLVPISAGGDWRLICILYRRWL